MIAQVRSPEPSFEEDEFIVGAGGRLRRSSHTAVKLFEPRFLVIAGCDDGQPRTDARIQNHRHPSPSTQMHHDSLVTAMSEQQFEGGTMPTSKPSCPHAFPSNPLTRWNQKRCRSARFLEPSNFGETRPLRHPAILPVQAAQYCSKSILRSTKGYKETTRRQWIPPS